MKQYLLLALLSACAGTSPDPRPATIEYISEAILVPSCGRAACHASGTNAKGYTFDTVAASKRSLIGHTGTLIEVISTETGKIMPPDGPIPEADIALIQTWFDNGAMGLQ